MDRISRKAARIEAQTERTIEAAYDDALGAVMEKHRAAFESIRRVLDGKTKPPYWCVTETMKERWRGKEVRRILQETGLQMALYRAAQEAGRKSSEAIREMINKAYDTAYEETLKHLMG